MANETGLKALGYFDKAGQTVPVYNPPVDALCPYCNKPMSNEDIRTFGFMNAEHIERSWFYRTHKTCDEKAGREKSDQVFRRMVAISETDNDNKFIREAKQ